MLSASAPSRDTVTIVNRSDAPVTVEVSNDARAGWLPISTVDPKERDRVEAVIDQGGVWRFRLSVGPDQVGELRRTSGQLGAAGWTVTIPADVSDKLREARRTSG
jgi:hypothetical protein